jgi:hypothetical protein
MASLSKKLILWIRWKRNQETERSMQPDKKKLKRDYQQDRRPGGVFQIRNLANEKVLVVAGLEVQGLINRHRFSLEMGGHQNTALQADWKEFGGQGFAFEILDQILPRADPNSNLRADLTALKELWLEKLQRPRADQGRTVEADRGPPFTLNHWERGRLARTESEART